MKIVIAQDSFKESLSAIEELCRLLPKKVRAIRQMGKLQEKSLTTVQGKDSSH